MESISTQINRLIKTNHYTHKPRHIEEIVRLGGVLYSDILNRNSGFRLQPNGAYEGYESDPEDPLSKMPNITCFWNLSFNSGGFIFASSMGHLHPNADFHVQEIYEFQGIGAMLLSGRNNLDLYVCKQGDKVAIPPDCMMTILNLSEDELLTLDMANPKENPSSKNVLSIKKGPMLAFYKDTTCSTGSYMIRLNSRYRSFNISKDIELSLDQIDGETLAEVLLRKRMKLGAYNIKVQKASPEIVCQGRDGGSVTLDSPLIEMVTSIEKPIHHLLGIN